MSVVQAKSQFYNSSGILISLSDEIARGGEGRILNVNDHPDLVAKIYHRAIDQEKATKLSVLVSLKTDRLLNLTAWPVDTLHDFAGGPVSGFLMPRITDHKDIHILYGVKSRNAEFPEAAWPFLIQAAANVARAFYVIHEHGHVIGDVNHGSIVVSKRATVRLVDCDSFQITTPEQQFLCSVGISTHLPPELQGRDLHGIVRTVDHDAFGLAVIIFQLLFMGRHPFSGTSLGPDDIPLEKAIKEHRFAYARDSAYRQMRQPPASLGLDAVSPQIGLMFEQAFLMDSNRPTAESWINALTDLSNDLQKCVADPAHYFRRSLESCPWCRIESHSGIVLFQGGAETGSFNLVKTWMEILSVPAPPRAALLNKSSVLTTNAEKQGTQIVWNQRKNGLIAASLVFISIFVLPFLLFLVIETRGISIIIQLYFVICSIAAFFANLFINDRTHKARLKLIDLQRSAERQLDEAKDIKNGHFHPNRFSKALVDLTAKKDQYEKLSELRSRKINDQQKALREHQLHEYLITQRIDSTDLSGINPRDVMALATCGIENADDIARLREEDVPGLKPSQKHTLESWQSRLKTEFRDRPRWMFTQANWASVEAEIASAKNQLQRELRAGPAYLKSISEQMRAGKDIGHPSIKDCLKAVSIAQEHLAECSSKFWVYLIWILYLAPLVVLFLFYGLR